MESLAKLFGSIARVKLLRLFAFHPDSLYDKESLLKKTRITPLILTKEIQALLRMGVLEKKQMYVKSAQIGKKKAVPAWSWNTTYPHHKNLTLFLRETLFLTDKDIRERLKGVGKIRLLIVGGFFTGNNDGTLDILIVGDSLLEEVIQKAMATLEAECGRDIHYSVLPVKEYQFRIRVRDKMLRDLIDFTHRKIVDTVVV
jgi:hypothetical protein